MPLIVSSLSTSLVWGRYLSYELPGVAKRYDVSEAFPCPSPYPSLSSHCGCSYCKWQRGVVSRDWVALENCLQVSRQEVKTLSSSPKGNKDDPELDFSVGTGQTGTNTGEKSSRGKNEFNYCRPNKFELKSDKFHKFVCLLA